MAGGILLEGDGAEAAGLDGIAGVVEVDRVDLPGAERLREVDEDGAGIALVLEQRGAEQDFVDVERGLQVELDARAVLQHLEADGVLAADELFLRVDADVEMVEEQIVVGAIGSVGAAQEIGVRRRRFGWWRRTGGWRCLRGNRRGTEDQQKENGASSQVEGPFEHGATLSRF